MEHKRGRYEICRDILKVARAGAGITAIVYGSNLNFPIANKNIIEMEANGLITVEVLPGRGGRNKLYVTTERGLAFINSLDETIAIFQNPDPILDVTITQEVSEA